ncbi:MAG TPA: PaaI family thioesterase [Campylobacterales bacterium]|nr:PaaI family thioesterase [Campylobacterales bacterium]HIO71037.1 PaaI family thioesterase [Campylobacterales bacterium]
MFHMLKTDREEREDTIEIPLNTHTEIYEKYSGRVEKVQEGFAEIHLDIVKEMIADEQGLIHSGFIFSGASFAAVVAVNEKYGFVIGSVVNFLAPVRDDDTIIYKAYARQKIGRKRVVDVIGQVGEIKVFIGEFTVVVMEKHILNIKLDEITSSEFQIDEK